jgi:hypothetical protein
LVGEGMILVWDIMGIFKKGVFMGSGYSISYEEFISLLADGSIIAMIERWFDGKLNIGERLFRKASGEALSIQALHEAIQANSEWQYQLYQAAMNIWR